MLMLKIIALERKNTQRVTRRGAIRIALVICLCDTLLQFVLSGRSYLVIYIHTETYIKIPITNTRCEEE